MRSLMPPPRKHYYTVLLDRSRRLPLLGIRLLQKAIDDLLFGFLFGKTQGHELDELLTRDLADGGLVDQRSLGVVGLDLRNGYDLSAIHDDGVALGVTRATVVAVDLGVEVLSGILLGHRAGYHVSAAVLAVQIHLEVGLGELGAVGHDLLVDDQGSAVGQLGLGDAVGGVHALDLRRLHLHVGALGHLHLGGGIHDAAALAVARAVVLLHVLDLGVLAQEEAVDAAVLAVTVACIVDATARHDGDVAVSADVEVVVDQLAKTRLGEEHGDVHALVLGTGLDVDIDTGGIGLFHDLNVLGGVLPLQLAVDAEGVSTLGHFMQVGYLRK